MKIGLLLIIGIFGFGLFQYDFGIGFTAILSSAKNHTQVSLASQESLLPTLTAAASPTPVSSPLPIPPHVRERTIEEFLDSNLGSPDVDCDGIWNSRDNCTFIYNPTQEDRDRDGNGDACDSGGLHPPSIQDRCDEDGDGVPDRKDNCPRACNPDQKDKNKNGVGDICDGSRKALFKRQICQKTDAKN